jgi:uncharacterized protein YrrD
MLQSVRNVTDCRILASDGEIGRVSDVYFDDEKWVVRYLIVDTGNWLRDRRVLISPHAVRLIDVAARAIAVTLSREQVKNSPDMDTRQPVSRQQEAEYYRYYGYRPYWGVATYWAWGAFPIVAPVGDPAEEEAEAVQAAERSTDSHLRSTQEVLGYHIAATDDSIGHAEDLLFDEETWAVRYLVVDTRNWWPGKHVLVGTDLLGEVNWLQRSLQVDLSRESVKSSPPYDPEHLPRSGDGSERPASSRQRWV